MPWPVVARELASHLRLKQARDFTQRGKEKRGEGTGFSSEIETDMIGRNVILLRRGEGTGFSSEIETG